jgi:hypothetical protein
MDADSVAVEDDAERGGVQAGGANDPASAEV